MIRRVSQGLTLVILIVLAAVLLIALAGCQTRPARAGIEEPTFDDAVMSASKLDAAKLTVSDGSLYQPAFRILDDRGRLRLIVQDPITHHYVIVR